MGKAGLWFFGGELAYNKGYQKFMKTLAVISFVAFLPITGPIYLWIKHKHNKKKSV